MSGAAMFAGLCGGEKQTKGKTRPESLIAVALASPQHQMCTGSRGVLVCYNVEERVDDIATGCCVFFHDHVTMKGEDLRARARARVRWACIIVTVRIEPLSLTCSRKKRAPRDSRGDLN